MYVLSINMWFQKLMRQFFFNIDNIVFNFISTVYDLLISIARTSVLSQADIIDMADRIYKLLAIFMVFKVTFSLIMYVVNPDDFSDKSKGISKLGTNIVISLTLLILTPYVFNMAYSLQTIVLEDNSIAALIFGDDSDKNNFLNTAGDSMAFMAMRPFFMPNVSLSLTDEDGAEISNLAPCTTLDDDCFTSMEEFISESNFTNTMLSNYKAGINVGNLGLTFRQNLSIATDPDGENFIMDYKYIFSTIIGVVIILLLITFCMDVAVRSIKLAFLQLIAPIPIISYVDPKSGKDGLFKKWYQMCFKTYLSLFLRILALYFAIYIISKIGKMVDIVDGSYQTNGFIAIFIIIGALMFAKQLPKILEGLGIKLDGGFQLNPLKKIEKDALGGKAISKAAGVPFKYAKGAAKGIGTAGLVGAAALATGQGLRGMGKAFLGGLKGDKFGKNFSSSYSAARARKKQVDKMKLDGVTPNQARIEDFKNKFRGINRKEQYDDFIASVKSVQDNFKSYYNGVVGADKIAKEFERERLAAENRGDSKEMQMWQDAIDARVKQVQKNGGRIALSVDKDGPNGTSRDITKAVNSVRQGAYDMSLEYSSESIDKGLVSIKNNNDKVINHINDNYNRRFDYVAGELSTKDDLKTINGKSKSVSRAAESSKEAREISDLYKYTQQSKK